MTFTDDSNAEGGESSWIVGPELLSLHFRQPLVRCGRFLRAPGATMHRRGTPATSATKLEPGEVTAWQLKQELADLQRRSEVILARSGLGTPEFEAEAERIRAESTKADLWDDPGTAWGAWKLGLGLGV
ncbi:prfB [Symbiodinium pilosum]|uniref:PrfB protein n=1 Tax=Symbiodinium pilosum TaxID=2952 RepID=A0A812JEI1_SYMPI|nr:prfB [Symbiodinium pilosum]